MMTLFIIAGWFYFIVSGLVWGLMIYKLAHNKDKYVYVNYTDSKEDKKNLSDSKESHTPIKETL